MPDDFRINITSSVDKNDENTILICTARLIYIGEDEEFIEHAIEQSKERIKLDELAYVRITFYSDSTKVKQYKYDYLDEIDEKWKVDTYDNGYNGFLHAFYNTVTQYQFDTQRFPFLQKTKGISYGMLLCCICKAYKLGFINEASNIILEASGSIWNRKDVSDKDSMINLVKLYEKIGFSQMFPDYIESGIENFHVPMVGKVKDILSVCTFSRVSKELLSILPIELCKDICED